MVRAECLKIIDQAQIEHQAASRNIPRTLTGKPRLLLTDEPTGNLNSQMARGAMELMEEINSQGATIVMVTHDPELAARAQRNVHIVDGQVTTLDLAKN